MHAITILTMWAELLRLSVHAFGDDGGFFRGLIANGLAKEQVLPRLNLERRNGNEEEEGEREEIGERTHLR